MPARTSAGSSAKRSEAGGVAGVAGGGDEAQVEFVVEEGERRREESGVRDAVVDFTVLRERPEIRARTGD